MFGRRSANMQGTDDALRNRVLAIAQRVMREQDIDTAPRADVSLDESGLGLNSMGRLELLRAIEQELAITVPEAYWGSKKFRDLDDVVRVVSRL